MIAWGRPGPKGDHLVPTRVPGPWRRSRTRAWRRTRVHSRSRCPERGRDGRFGRPGRPPLALGARPGEPHPGPRLPAGRPAAEDGDGAARPSADLRRQRAVRHLLPRGNGGLPGLRPCPGDAARDRGDRARSLRSDHRHAQGRRLDVLPPRREVRRPDRRAGREAGQFEIAYTFGADPLQQYLIRFPDGRLQALGLAWDTRPRADGGQRWFHLYPGVTLRPPDPFHWTGREQTWNYQCAECHSTDLRKGYDVAANRYATTWAELTVSCEECHGPGSAHVAWAEGRPPGAARPPPGATGLVVRLGRGEGAWAIRDTERGIAEWTGPPRASMELDVCARCHARRRPIIDPHVYGRPFLDTHVPALLEPGLYHADGQVLGEVYEWGSFVQSRMQRAGVLCSDCHEPHRTALRAPGNAVCAQCHLPAKFDTPAHHHHRVASDAARCVSCHMPARTHMVVDPRRDHSFRVPRPDLSVTLGTPNACTGCHRDRPPQWAADRVAAWRGPARPPAPHFAEALDAARRGRPEAGPALAALATDQSHPRIARATALAHLSHVLRESTAPAVESALRDPDALVRMGALRAAEALPPARRGPLAAPLLQDPVRAVRLAAVHALADVALPEAQKGRPRARAGRVDPVGAGQRRPPRGPPEPRLPLRPPRAARRRGRVGAPNRPPARPPLRAGARQPRRPSESPGPRCRRRALPRERPPRGPRASRGAPRARAPPRAPEPSARGGRPPAAGRRAPARVLALRVRVRRGAPRHGAPRRGHHRPHGHPPPEAGGPRAPWPRWPRTSPSEET